jgi:hypothetical protein
MAAETGWRHVAGDWLDISTFRTDLNSVLFSNIQCRLSRNLTSPTTIMTHTILPQEIEYSVRKQDVLISKLPITENEKFHRKGLLRTRHFRLHFCHDYRQLVKPKNEAYNYI